MTYDECLHFLYSQLPMFQRQGAAAYKANLDNTLALAAMLGQPENSFPAVHIAGTNGKGSTAHMIASVLQQQGYTTGLYTSPHLIDFRERIKINGEMIPKEEVVNFVEKYREDFRKIQPSFFEITFAVGLDYFRNRQVDIVVMETGMGGRLDSTNIVNSHISLITNIGLDHTQFLGDTLEKIAGEKAGIIKKGVPVIIGEHNKETDLVFRQRAEQMHAPLIFSEEMIKLEKRYSDSKQCFEVKVEGRKKGVFCIPLMGKYQEANLRSALAVLYKLDSMGDFPLSDENIRKGLSCVVKNTGFMGRWQELSSRPKIICDTGHNEDGLKYVLQQLKEEQYSKLHFVLGMVNDKDVDKVLCMLPADAEYYFCRPDIPRGLDVNILEEKARKASRKGSAYSSVAEALKSAREKAETDDLIFIGGSTFVVAEVLAGNSQKL